MVRVSRSQRENNCCDPAYGESGFDLGVCDWLILQVSTCAYQVLHILEILVYSLCR